MGHLFLLVGKRTEGGESARVHFGGSDPEHSYRLTLSSGSAALHRLDDGGSRLLAEQTQIVWPSEFELGIRCLGKRIVVAVDGSTVLRTEDDRYHDKGVGVKCEGAAVQLKVRRVQRLGEIAFNDSFMRAGATGAWSPLSGYWEFSGMKEATYSPNPFALFARFPESPKLDELFEGRTRRYTGIGVRVAYRTDRAHIVAVHPGSPAEGSGLHAGAEIFEIDGETAVGTSRDDIVSRILGPPGSELTLTVRRPFGFDRRVRQLTLCRKELDLDRVDTELAIQPATHADVSLITAGHYFWADYTMEAAVRPLGGAFGLVFGARDAQHYYLLEWADALRLVRVWSDQRTILAERPGRPGSGQHYTLRVALDGPAIEAYVDDAEALRAESPPLSWGKAGLFAAKGRGAYFDDVRIEPTASFVVRSRILATSTTFQHDKIMHKWADPKRDWRLTGGSYWHRYSFPGDVCVSWQMASSRSLALELSAAQQQKHSGYTLVLVGGNRSAELRRKEQVVARGQWNGYGHRWELERHGPTITARADEQPVLTYTDPEPLRGDAVRKSSGWSHAGPIHVHSHNALEYAFDRMPVDWTIAAGKWGMMNRWICTPKWSWFGGRSHALAAVWHKRVLDGDVSLDAYVGFEMSPFQRSAYERTADLGLTICGDGLSLSSGYTLVVGAENNRVTRLYREGRIVAQAPYSAARFPQRRSRGRGGFDVHRDWFQLHFGKRDHTISFRLNDKPGITYHDPDPLIGGQTAVWTVNNGVLLARVRLAGERITSPGFDPTQRSVFNDGHWTNCVDGEITARIEPVPGAEGTYRFQSVGAGPCAVLAKFGTVDAMRSPVLHFGYRMRPDTRTDLFFELEGVRHRIRLTGREAAAADPLTVGEIHNARADDRWHTARFPLLKSLQARYSDRDRFAVDGLRFANYYDDLEGLAGFSCNRPDSGYWIRGFRVSLEDAHTTEGITVAKVEAPFDAPSRSEAFVFHFQGGDGCGLDTSQAWVRCGAKRIGVPSRGVRVCQAEGTLRVEPAAMDIVLSHSQVLRVEVGGMSDSAGNTMAQPYATQWRFDSSRDTRAPVIRSIRPKVRRVLAYDFESSTDDFAPTGVRPPSGGASHPVWVGRSAARWASGQCSLRVLGTQWQPAIGTVLNSRDLDFGKTPLLVYQYCLPPSTSRFSVTVKHEGEHHNLWSSASMAAWLRMPIDVFSVLKRADPNEMAYTGSRLHFTLHPPMPSRRDRAGGQFFLDDVELWPVLGPRDLSFTWEAPDLSGIKAHRCVLDRNFSTTPTSIQDPSTYARVDDGLAYFHLMVQDGAGNWSKPFHQPMLLDRTPPKVASAAVADGLLEFVLDEARGLDPASVRLRVGPHLLSIDNERAWYDQVRKRLKVRLGGLGADIFTADGRALMQIRQAQDFAGNALAGDSAWVMPKGHQGPLAPVVAPRE